MIIGRMIKQEKKEKWQKAMALKFILIDEPIENQKGFCWSKSLLFKFCFSLNKKRSFQTEMPKVLLR